MIPESAHLTSIWGSIPGWIAALTSTGSLGLIGKWVLDWRRQNLTSKVSDRQGYGDLIERMSLDIASLTGRVTAAETKASEAADEASRAKTMAAGMKLRLGQYEFAMRLMLGEFEIAAPENAVLKQVRGLLASLFPIELETSIPNDMLETLDKSV